MAKEMKKHRIFTLIILSSLTQCKNTATPCTTREWQVIDLYRNNYPSLKDTTCNDSTTLVNGAKLGPSFSDTVFNHTGSNKNFSLDTNGTYQIATTANITVNGAKYEAAKVIYLHKGDNIDQAFFLYVIKGKGIYIQQESHDKNLFLLKEIKRDNTPTENTEPVTNEILKDTVLFPLPPG